MKRIIGIFLIVLVLYGLVLTTKAGRTLDNHQRLAERLGLFGMLTLGAGIVILSGGIDLSMGSVVCLSGVGLGLLLQNGVPGGVAILLVLGGAAVIGLLHGLLITRLRLQPFIVTLCGMFIWRGVAYWLALEKPLVPLQGLLRLISFGALFPDASTNAGSAGNVGIGEQEEQLQGLLQLSTGYPQFGFLNGIPFLSWINDVPIRLWLLLFAAGLLALLLHASVYGRYLFAVGANEQAARYAGIGTSRYKILSYVLCAMLAAVAGMLEQLDVRTVSPSKAGAWYELFAITGAVLGGCSLRGGEGTIPGLLLGAAVLPLLRNLCNFSGLPDDLQPLVIGLALLAGTVTDDLLKRRAAARGTG